MCNHGRLLCSLEPRADSQGILRDLSSLAGSPRWDAWRTSCRGYIQLLSPCGTSVGHSVPPSQAEWHTGPDETRPQRPTVPIRCASRVLELVARLVSVRP